MRTFRSLLFVAWGFLTFVPLCAMQISLEQVLKSGTAQDVQQALQTGRLDARGKSRIGYPWIVWAAMFNPNPEVISLLLKAGADVNVSGGINNSTPLGVAAWNNTPEVVSVLLKAGAHVNATNQFGSTPLMVAAGHNPKAREVIALLLDAGAEVNAKDLSGRTALDYARHDASLPEKYISSAADPALVQQLLAAAHAQPAAPKAATAASIELDGLSFDDIYPVFHNYYDTHSLGSVVLRNTSGTPITGIKVSFQIKEFMDDPKDCPAPAELGPGESKSVDLFGLFLPAILEMTEKTKAQARVDVEYTLNRRPQHQYLVQSIPILNRNATSWADDRRAAAFVTIRDPVVLSFSKNVNSMVRGKIQGAINPDLLTALAFFQTLQIFGLTYSQDPIPTVTANSHVADFIQFPRETLQYKGGKCSDFSVLYSALLESVGIETAFITIPGHIFVAFSLDMHPDEVRKAFSRPADLIYRNEKSWIPVEVTESAGFLRAWQDGAREWRESSLNNQAAFYPLHDAWKLYEPVALSG
ncbi:MAG: ankyrin repeat domain-containing protein, partial [Spirochaetia bacterium]